MNSDNGDDDNKVRGGYQNHTLRPVTIKQLNSVPLTDTDIPVSIDGEDVKQITFVGVVRNVTKQPVNLIYTIEDGSGKIDTRVWTNDNANQADDDNGNEGAGGNQEIDPELSVGKYVRVYGELKFFNGKRHVSAHSIRPVKDHNEVTYHGLEAMYVHLTKTRGPAPALGSSGAQQPGMHASALPQATLYSGSGGYGQMGGDNRGLSAVQLAILEVVKASPRTPQGVQTQSIQQSLSSQYSGAQVTTAVEWLISEGHLYNTIDESHVLSTDS
ncbi:replication protein A, subunit RPA32 [Martensiomyces pterosporus]|nr:replication protein A, subunit RPA32 [Martensiomyces pterosporus]